MKRIVAALIEKHGSWWVGSIVGDFRYSFICDPDNRHLPRTQRIQAASDAFSMVFRHWEFWIGLGVLIAGVVGFCALDQLVRNGGNGTMGAVFGFIVGDFALGYAVYRSGLESYRANLQAYDEANPSDKKTVAPASFGKM